MQSRKDVGVFGKPESRAHPKDKKTNCAAYQLHDMQNQKSGKQLSKHNLTSTAKGQSTENTEIPSLCLIKRGYRTKAGSAIPRVR